MTKNSKRAIGTFAACVWALTPAAFAGGTFINSVQDGDWSSAATWDIGPPDATPGDQARISHLLSVTSAGQSANVVHVGWSAGNGTLNVSAGNLLAASYLIVGDGGNLGILNLTGGDIVSGNVRVGVDGPAALTISGGSLTIGEFLGLEVGIYGSPGEVTIVGGSSTIIAASLAIGADATLVIQPTSNGAVGLSTIGSGGGVTLNAGSTLELDISSYTPVVGDSWDVITYAGSVSGTFGTLTAPAGYAIEEDQTVSGVVTIRVTAVGGPDIPTVSEWGLVAMGLLVLTAGAIMLRHRRGIAV